MYFQKSVAPFGKKSKENIAFSKSTLTTSLKHLIQNCYLVFGNSLLKQKIGILMGLDPASFWANPFLYTYENEHMPEPISNDKAKALMKMMGVYSMMFTQTSILLNYNWKLNALVHMPLS